MIRVGLGQDSHRLVFGSGQLIMAGRVVGDGCYLQADSDGDVVIHALCNALSTAIGGGSLDTWAGEMSKNGVKNSKDFLRVIFQRVMDMGYVVGNLAVMIEATKPRLEEYREEMQESLAGLLEIEKQQVGIAFTSGDGLTDFGRGEGIQAFVMLVIEK